MDKKPEKLVPEVRFKGFTDDWEQRKLGEISKRVRNNDGRMNLPLLTISARYGWMTQQSRFSASIAGREKKNYTLLKKHQLSYNHGNSKVANYGTVYELTDYDEALVPKVYHSFSLTSENSSKFIESYFHTKKLDAQLRKFIASTARMDGLLNISFDDFMKVKLFAPERCEQSKISRIINLIEKLITLQQRKLEILIKLKQSFLTKIMANNIDKNPELYFNSASIKWLKQELSNLTIKEFKGNTKLNDTKTGKTEYLDAERLNGNVPLFIDKPINTLKSDILILWDGSKAGSVYYGFEGSLGSTLKAIRLNPKLVNSFFVYQQLKSKQDVIFNKYRTPNIPHVIKNFTKVYPIYFPSMAVQNKIARFLGNLDTLIEIQQKSIKDHKVIKKYLLQKLFI
ncbi:restriction endonuclease subunit S [Limosilactobacillus reuteri]|uniref:Restriction endonuclease subunit S n=3 Tax=Limosilactobacillus reuteri TaxID=1598 RepID=A0AAW9ZN81_LIMRT|nr:restriction endonuclease subunit S [Limosilactobacillus reuteri]MCC4354354.1 restriction endonuclease subunit S [Limosilactobacillus reuteri]NME22667.1 restriction endonuclease subunit S [Limosilactobacillus reuteri]